MDVPCVQAWCMGTARRDRNIRWLLGLALIVAVALLVRVGQKKRDAEGALRAYYDLAMNPHPGMYVPVYEGRVTSGQAVRLADGAGERRQILYFFTTACPYCRASIPAWKEILSSTTGRTDVDVYGVAVDTSDVLEEYELEHDLSYPIVRMTDPRFVRLFRVTGVPLTMIVDPTGRVAYARRGEFSAGALVDSVLQVLDTPLPEAAGASLRVPSVGAAARVGGEPPN